MIMDKIAVILLAHGSRNHEEITKAMNDLLARVSFFLPPNITLFSSFLQFNSPDLEETLRLCSSRNVSRVFILPFFLITGRHLAEDIPQEVERLKRGFPHLDITLCKSIGSQSWFFDSVVRWLLDEIPDSYWATGENGMSPLSGPEIREKSFGFVDALCLPQMDLDEAGKRLMIRLIHATGDPTSAALLRWSEGALDQGIQAFRRGSPIVTDVKMVKAGLNDKLISRLGCRVHCATEVGSCSEPEGRTRAWKGIEALSPCLDGSVVAIGNAPTALLSILKTFEEKRIAPSLVIGMPVGFVNAPDSKRRLMTSGLPYITVEGAKGGSAMVVATVNALMEIAVEGMSRGD